MPWRKTLAKSLSPPFVDALDALGAKEAARLTEIRVRVGQRAMWVFVGGARPFGEQVTQARMEELLSALCAYSRYAFESQMAQGFIPLEGGHRAGVCGRVAYEDGHIVRLSAVSSVCIRIARTVDGASAPVRRYLFTEDRPARVLILGAPGSGKTTVLRDAAEYLAKDCGLFVCAADEREELADACVDALRGARKADAVRMLVRSMAPQVLVTDEIGRMEDADALLDAASCGVGLLASAHAAGMEDVWRRPALRALFSARAFDWYLLLGRLGSLAGAWDASGSSIMEGQHGELGCGCDVDDRDQRDRLFAGGWRKPSPEMGSGDAALPFAHERRRSL